ncbi:hypothetical protein [Micromonospora sp. WMMD736]|uniref:hypothetical protein n=1 Tax=Micromonospora sp. WMMD736 TaxID=3404112 RepID=UPI003B92ACBC
MSGERRERDGLVGAPRAGALWRGRGDARRHEGTACRRDRDRAVCVAATAVPR